MAPLENDARGIHRSDQRCHRNDQKESEFQKADGFRLESGRRPFDGLAALPHPVPILCHGWEAQLPTVPAERGYIFGRAIQHSQLRFIDASDRKRNGA